MNILIVSPGRRVEIIEYFKKEVHKLQGKVYCADMSKYAAALYAADEYFILKKDFNNLNKYIDDVIKVCLDKKIEYVLTLIDPELKLFSDYADKFKSSGITLILSNRFIIDNTFDKLMFYNNFKNYINLVKTYGNYDEIICALKRGEINYPIFAKDRCGSGSSGLCRINNKEELENFKNETNKIFQPFLECTEYGVDVYFDMISGKIASLFIKEKIGMRSGETDKARSVFNKDIVDEILKLEKINGFCGCIDVDVFIDKQEKVYINEINPRFGGGYPHAYNCGVNFMQMIINNLNQKENVVNIGDYKDNIVMMKYNGTIFRDDIR